MFEWEEVFRALTNRGLLSARKIINYAFPDKERSEPKITDKQWVKVTSYIAPIFALILLSIIYRDPPSFFSYFPHLGPLFFLVVIGYATFFTLFLFIISLIVKIKNRSPAVLLILTPFAPLKAFLFFGIINFIFTSSGFEQLAKEITTWDQKPREMEQMIKQNKAALRERREKAEEKFRNVYEEYKENSRARDEAQRKWLAEVEPGPSEEELRKKSELAYQQRQEKIKKFFKESSEKSAREWQEAMDNFRNKSESISPNEDQNLK